VAAFQYLLVHLFVTHVTSAVAAGSVNQNFAAYSIRSRIEMDRATLHIERSMHGMEHVTKREIHQGLIRHKT
jgi:hypothetical protein